MQNTTSEDPLRLNAIEKAMAPNTYAVVASIEKGGIVGIVDGMNPQEIGVMVAHVVIVASGCFQKVREMLLLKDTTSAAEFTRAYQAALSSQITRERTVFREKTRGGK